MTTEARTEVVIDNIKMNYRAARAITPPETAAARARRRWLPASLAPAPPPAAIRPRHARLLAARPAGLVEATRAGRRRGRAALSATLGIKVASRNSVFHGHRRLSGQARPYFGLAAAGRVTNGVGPKVLGERRQEWRAPGFARNARKEVSKFLQQIAVDCRVIVHHNHRQSAPRAHHRFPTHHNGDCAACKRLVGSVCVRAVARAERKQRRQRSQVRGRQGLGAAYGAEIVLLDMSVLMYSNSLARDLPLSLARTPNRCVSCRVTILRMPIPLSFTMIS